MSQIQKMDKISKIVHCVLVKKDQDNKTIQIVNKVEGNYQVKDLDLPFKIVDFLKAS